MAERRRAFGLDLEGDLELPGTEADGATTGLDRRFALSRATRAGVLGGWPAAEAADVSRRRTAAGRTAQLIAAHPRAGFLLRADGYGVYRIDAQARGAACAPLQGAPAWRWQRFVTAQVLPFAAVLHGIEGLHAGAVALEGRAVAIAAGSGGGKSTLVGALVLRGARLVADDVVAVEPDGAGVIVHPGPGVLSLRAGALPELGPGSASGARLVTVARESRSLPFGALVLLRREAGARRIAIQSAGPPDPRVLLGSTFNAAWRTAQRLESQLDICARIAATVPVLALRAPLDAPAERLAQAVERAVNG